MPAITANDFKVALGTVLGYITETAANRTVTRLKRDNKPNTETNDSGKDDKEVLNKMKKRIKELVDDISKDRDYPELRKKKAFLQ